MKTLILPVFALAMIAFAAPAVAAGGCGWSQQTTEKPVEKPVEDASV
jgi:hypothetical protein